MESKEKELDSEVCTALKSIVDHFEQEDISVRDRQIKRWKRLKLYWNNLNQIYWSETAQDYRIFGVDGNLEGENDQSYYDRPVNVFKAFLEAIIAALSVQIPSAYCIPDDADNPLDISTAKAGDKIAEIIYKHNDAIYLWLQALYVHCTEGLIACYHYPLQDKSFGTYKEAKYKKQEVEGRYCPECDEELDETVFESKNEDESLEEESVTPITCPHCEAEIDPNLKPETRDIEVFDKYEIISKTRIMLEVYGGLYVKVANYARQQADTPYLKFAYETHYANVMHKYPHAKELNLIPKGEANSNTFGDTYASMGRLNTQYRGEVPDNNVTVSEWWLRPASYNVLTDEQCDNLKAKFPNGVKVCLVNETVIEYYSEALDDRWTLARNPMADYLTHEPLGELLVNIQDIVNDLISLILQTIEHGIEQTWADPAVVNFEEYSQIEAAPGTITPTKAVSSNKRVSEAFYSTKTASLSPETFKFYDIIQQLGQFTSGALPSLFGGQQGKSSSQTASEYAMSRNMALQRLQTPWKMMVVWWREIFSKVIPQYMENIAEDERFVEKDQSGNFVNTFIRKAEIAGKLGDIELDASEQIPITDEQQKDIIMELMQLNNQELNQALLNPENLPFIKKLIRIPQFQLVGEEDRQKQYEEINKLINTEPITIPPNEQEVAAAMASGMPPPLPQQYPSVEIDEIVDNHQIEASICRTWLISETGRLAKEENPAGYMNVMLHMKAHLDIMAKVQMQQQQAIQPEQPNPTPGEKIGRPETISGEADVRTPAQ